MHQAHPVAEGSQSLGGSLQGGGIAVEPDDAQPGVGGEKSHAVPSPANGGVDEDTGGHRCKEGDDLIA